MTTNKNEATLSNTSFLQSDFWAAFKSQHGWKAVQTRVSYTDEFDSITPNQNENIIVLLRRLKPFGSLAYIPMAPVIDVQASAKEHEDERAYKRGKLLHNIAEQIKTELPKDVFMLRFDPPWELVQDNTGGKSETVEFPHSPHHPSIKKSSTDIQPPHTVCLDLSLSQEALLAQCKSKWRYNIRLAEKKGVNVTTYANADLQEGIDIFYTLYQETATRDGIAIHTKRYYADLARIAVEHNADLRVYVAEYENTHLAAIVTLFMPNATATYLYGASSNKHRNVMPAYLLQWKALCDAQHFGCKRYDFYGIPPCDDKSHPMYGLYRFKTGFGGSIVRRVGSVDVPLKKTVYCAYRTAEKLRTFWYKKVKKLFR